MSTICMWVQRSSWLAFEKENSSRYNCMETNRTIRIHEGSMKNIIKTKSNLCNCNFQDHKSRWKMLVFQTYCECSDKQLLRQETGKHPGNRSPLEHKKKLWENVNYFCNYYGNIFSNFIPGKLVRLLLWFIFQGGLKCFHSFFHSQMDLKHQIYLCAQQKPILKDKTT